MRRSNIATSPANSRAQSPLPRTAQPLTFWGRVGKFAPKIAASAGLIGAGIIADQAYNNGIIKTAKDIYEGTKNTIIGIGRGAKEVGGGFVNGYHAFKSAFNNENTKQAHGGRVSETKQIADEIHQGTSRPKNNG